VPGFFRGESFLKAKAASVTAVTFSRGRSGESGHWNGDRPQVNLLGGVTAGNLLVAAVVHRNDLATDPAIEDSLAGTWTLRLSRAVDLTRTHDRRKLWVFTKIANGSEGQFYYSQFASTVQSRFSVTEIQANTSYGFEFIGAGGADTGIGATTSEPVYANYGGTTDPTITTAGVSATPQGGKSLLRVSIMGGRIGESGDFGSSWSFAGSNVQYQASGGYQTAQCVGFGNDETGGGALADTLDWTSLYLQPTIAHLVFGAGS
jgi:hypothetical protein